ncbi:MAG: cupin domain-containing protein [Methylophilaceae bacterium]
MATHHVSSGELINLRPLGAPLNDSQSTTLLHDEQLRVMRLVLPAGKALPEHAVDGPITMHCIEGVIDVIAQGSCKTMRASDFMYLAGNVPHALRATEDASLLVTIVLEKPST